MPPLSPNDMCILLYSNSEYNFLWKATIPLLQRYAPGFKVYFCCDTTTGFTIPEHWTVFTYKTGQHWGQRVSGCVEVIQEKYILYVQEDWLLIDYIYSDIITYILEFMQSQGCEYMSSYIREIYDEPPIATQYPMYEFQRDTIHYFQPAIWSRSLLYRLTTLHSHVQTSSLMMAENENGKACDLTRECICYVIQNTAFPKDISTRTIFFPHMHAINQGKWTFLKYPTLKALVEAYGIDTSLRGIDIEWIVHLQ